MVNCCAVPLLKRADYHCSVTVRLESTWFGIAGATFQPGPGASAAGPVVTGGALVGGPSGGGVSSGGPQGGSSGGSSGGSPGSPGPNNCPPTKECVP